MKYIRQFLIIITISFLGEILHMLLPLPIPASIYGLVLMFGGLCTRLIKPCQIKETAGFLIDIMTLMFVPAVAGLINEWTNLKGILVPVLFITISITIFVMAVTGRVTQRIMGSVK